MLKKSKYRRDFNESCRYFVKMIIRMYPADCCRVHADNHIGKCGRGYGQIGIRLCRKQKSLNDLTKSLNDSTKSLNDLTKSLNDLTKSLKDLTFVMVMTGICPCPFPCLGVADDAFLTDAGDGLANRQRKPRQVS